MTSRVHFLATAVILLLALVPVSSIAGLGARPGAMQETQEDQGAIAKRSDIYCTGFISDRNPRGDMQVVGGIRENQRYWFVQGDKVYINKGFDSHIQEGSVYQILRPLGEFKHPFTEKSLGYFVKELGLLKVIDVDKKVSTAEITVSCDTVTFGDVLRPFQPSPPITPSGPAIAVRRANNQPLGQIILSPRYQEFLSANQIAYIDVGAKSGLQPGDRLTILRKVGKSEGIFSYRDDEVGLGKNKDLGSNRFRGEDHPLDETVEPHEEVLRKRPEPPAKVVGQMVVLKVEGSTSVAMITKNSEWINIGDWVERPN